jgi:uncharacterized membrane protein
MFTPGIHYFPVSPLFVGVLLLLLVVVFLMVVLRVLRYAYTSMGVPPQYFFAILVLSLLGSYINIPLLEFPEARVMSGQEVWIFGVPHIVPMVQDWPGTVLAINVGGGLIPALLSVYLIAKNGILKSAAIGTAIVAAACYMLAYPVEGIGIALPIFYPPVIAAVVALFLSRTHAAPLAYISGTIGTLIGADLMNLGKVQALGAPVVSIGGAGTFDGIFVTGLVAVLLASFAGRRPARAPRWDV